MPTPVTIKAPNATSVTALHVVEGVAVVQGQPLLDLADDEQQIGLVRMLAHRDKLKSSLARIENTGDIKSERDNLERQQAFLRDRLNHLKSAEPPYRFKFEVKRITIDDFVQYKNEFYQARYDEIVASAKLQQFEDDVVFTTEQIKVWLSLAEDEVSYAKWKVARMRLSAPSNGKVSLHVRLHDPVRRGAILCIIR